MTVRVSRLVFALLLFGCPLALVVSAAPSTKSLGVVSKMEINMGRTVPVSGAMIDAHGLAHR